MSKGTWKKVAAVLAGCALVVVGTDAVTYSATGHSLILGKINKAGTTTSVVNTGRGPVLNLSGGKLYPPLKVNSKKVVTSFNADLLDGKHASQLAPGVTRLGIGRANITTATSRLYTVKIPAGWYQFTLAGVVSSTTNTDSFVCLMGDLHLLVPEPPADPDYANGYYTYDQGSLDAGRKGVIGETTVMKVRSGATVVYGCMASGVGPLTQGQPITFTYRAVPTPRSKTGTPYDPSPRILQRITAR
jgi:hypothetical protein